MSPPRASTVIPPISRLKPPPELIPPISRLKPPPELIPPISRLKPPPELIPSISRLKPPPELIPPISRLKCPAGENNVFLGQMAVQLVKILSVVHFDLTGQTYLCIGPLAAWAGGGRLHTRNVFLQRISLEGSAFPLCEGKLKCRSGLATCDGKQTTASKSARSLRATPFSLASAVHQCEHAVCAVVNLHARCRSREHMRVVR